MKKVKLTKLGKRVKRILNIILVLLLLFNVSKPVKADIETDISFKGFNIENISTMSTTDWPSFSQETLFDNNQISIKALLSNNNFSAASAIDLTDIQKSVDFGNLKLNFSIDIFQEEEDDIGRIQIEFRDLNTNAIKTELLERSKNNLGSYESISANYDIPINTQSIRFIIEGLNTTNTNTIRFKQASAIIIDNDSPILTSDYEFNWTNTAYTVNLNATDSESGIEGIYNADTDQRLTENSNYMTVQKTPISTYAAASPLKIKPETVHTYSF